MKKTQKLTLAAMLAVLAGAVVGLYLTPGSGPSRHSFNPTRAPQAEAPAIDQRGLDTVRRLAYLAATPEEQQAAKFALDSADHDLDLQYAYAMQLSSIEPAPDTPEIHAIQGRIAKNESGITTRQRKWISSKGWSPGWAAHVAPHCKHNSASARPSSIFGKKP